MHITNTFFHVNAPAGSGKTRSAINWAIKQACETNQKTVIVLKSKRLMDEAAKTAQAAQTKLGVSVRVTCINRDTINTGPTAKGAKSVRLAILNHLNATVTGQGELLFITEAAFIMLADWPGRPHWHIVMDDPGKVSGSS
jgi:hypothetical protein